MNAYLKVAVISLIAFIPATAVSQDSSASIRGTVYGPDGETIPDAPIQITNSATDDYQRTSSDANGDYVVTRLPAGSYRLTVSTPINMPVGSYRPYESEVVEIVLNEIRELDISLKHGFSIGTIGDDMLGVYGYPGD